MGIQGAVPVLMACALPTDLCDHALHVPHDEL